MVSALEREVCATAVKDDAEQEDDLTRHEERNAAQCVALHKSNGTGWGFKGEWKRFGFK